MAGAGTGDLCGSEPGGDLHQGGPVLQAPRPALHPGFRFRIGRSSIRFKLDTAVSSPGFESDLFLLQVVRCKCLEQKEKVLKGGQFQEICILQLFLSNTPIWATD